MDKNDLKRSIIAIFSEVFSDYSEGLDIPELKDETILLETGLDSLGFAILVTRMEEELQYDPFSLSEEAFYPVTFKEFVDFYFENQPT